MFDYIIVGAGIIGLATALELLERNPDIQLAIIEKEDSEAKHQTGRNSGVLHSGIYYTPGSLKAKNCIDGYYKMIDFCREHEVDFDICGKVIVATSDDQLPALEKIYQNGLSNGLEGIRYINQEELYKIEPHISSVNALLVPQTGIIDYKRVCSVMRTMIVSKGGQFFFGHKVLGIEQEPDTIKVLTSQQTIQGKFLITCAGLYSDKLAGMTGIELPCKITPFRGEYFKLKEDKKHLVNHLVYPVPDPNFPFLGVHFTRMINGDREAGPNAVLAFAREGYTKLKINIPELAETLLFSGFRKLARKHMAMGIMEMKRSFSKKAFARELQKLMPEIEADDLEPAIAGVRAQALNNDGSLVDDFLFAGSKNVLHVVNAPSPAATSSLAIATHIADKVAAAGS
ncbi:MAG: L-2-hydroxyglutarate oxidase [Bacteroidetes bacterium]|nr:L-2-hydroxyglutarate oxidase [Bacteroidota bacterium]